MTNGKSSSFSFRANVMMSILLFHACRAQSLPTQYVVQMKGHCSGSCRAALTASVRKGEGESCFFKENVARIGDASFLFLTCTVIGEATYSAQSAGKKMLFTLKAAANKSGASVAGESEDRILNPYAVSPKLAPTAGPRPTTMRTQRSSRSQIENSCLGPVQKNTLKQNPNPTLTLKTGSSTKINQKSAPENHLNIHPMQNSDLTPWTRPTLNPKPRGADSVDGSINRKTCSPEMSRPEKGVNVYVLDGGCTPSPNGGLCATMFPMEPA